MQPQQQQFDLTQAPSWVFPLLMFCIGIFFTTAIIRRAVEMYLPGFAERNQWKKVWLPSLPVIVGGVAATIMSRYPFLSTLPTWGTRALYGCVAGGLSSFMYKVVQATIQAKLGVKVRTSDSPGELDQSAIDTLPPKDVAPDKDECGSSGPHTLPSEKKP